MIGNRIKEIRKRNSLNQIEFGEKIGVKQSSIASYENGSRQPVDAVILSICREFNVSEKWLRTGEGEPFKALGREEQIADYFRDLEGLNDELKKRLVSALAAIREEDWLIIKRLVDKIVADGEKNDKEKNAVDQQDATPEELETVRQLRENKKQAGAS